MAALATTEGAAVATTEGAAETDQKMHPEMSLHRQAALKFPWTSLYPGCLLGNCCLHCSKTVS